MGLIIGVIVVIVIIGLFLFFVFVKSKTSSLQKQVSQGVGTSGRKAGGPAAKKEIERIAVGFNIVGRVLAAEIRTREGKLIAKDKELTPEHIRKLNDRRVTYVEVYKD